jgi:hypothetical protein
MEIGRCLTLGELFDRVASSRQMVGWYAYLEIRDKREHERLQQMFGEQ